MNEINICFLWFPQSKATIVHVILTMRSSAHSYLFILCPVFQTSAKMLENSKKLFGVPKILKICWHNLLSPNRDMELVSDWDIELVTGMWS